MYLGNLNFKTFRSHIEEIILGPGSQNKATFWDKLAAICVYTYNREELLFAVGDLRS